MGTSSSVSLARAAFQNQARGFRTSRRCLDTPSITVRPSRWTWDIFKDQLHFYILIAAVPIGALITYLNVFVGPAELRPIPEGYVPKEIEYERSPVVRWLKTTFNRPGWQERYERQLHDVWQEEKTINMKQLRDEVHRQMKLHGNYKGWYYRDDLAHYTRVFRKSQESSLECQGHRFYGDGPDQD